MFLVKKYIFLVKKFFFLLAFIDNSKKNVLWFAGSCFGARVIKTKIWLNELIPLNLDWNYRNLIYASQHQRSLTPATL